MVGPRLKLDIVGDDKTAIAFRSVRNEISKTSGVIKTFGRSFAGAALGSAIVTSLVDPIGRAADALNEFDQIAKRARTSGLSTDFYQSLQLAAEEANVSQSLLNSSLIALTKRLGELRAGTGPLATGLKGVDTELLKQLQSARSTEEALRLLADATKNAKSATDAARIANAAFGRSGVELVRVLNLGSQGFDETAKKARELGLIIDRDLLANAEQLNNDFGVATRVLDIQFKQALVNLAPAITATAQAINDFAASTRRAIAIWRFFTGTQREARDEVEKTSETVNRAAKSDLQPLVDPPKPKLNPLRDLTNRFELVREKSKVTTDSVTADLKSLGETGETAFTRFGDAAESAFSRLRLTGNQVIDELISKLATFAVQEFFRPAGSPSSRGGGLGAIAGALGGGGLFGGFRASGGRVRPGQGFVVGERGAETFFPDRAGTIVPGVSMGPPIINITDNAGVDISASTDRGLDGQDIINLVVNSRQFGTAVDRQINRGTSAGLRR